MIRIGRRGLLQSTAAATGLAALPWRQARPAGADRRLAVVERTIEVHGRAANVLGIEVEGGGNGLILTGDEPFRARMENRIAEPTLIHWHGLTPPWRQDGVPGLSAPPITPGEAALYDFAPLRPGTHWMHAHMGLQEQRLLAAPLIVRDPAELSVDRQEVVVMLHDFSFAPPEELLTRLIGSTGGHAGHGGNATAAPVDHAAMGHGAPAAPAVDHAAMGHAADSMGGMAMDLNDIEYDAYLANDRTLDDPEIVRVAPGQNVRLRIINGASATNFFIDLGPVEATLVAVDGNPVTGPGGPVTGHRFPIAMAQRLDLEFAMPADGGTVPVLALREGTVQRTGVVLAPPSASISRISREGEKPAGVVDQRFELGLRASAPWTDRPADRVIRVGLIGTMEGYSWGLDGLSPDGILTVRQAERVEIAMANPSMMSHPMHLHGHHFRVVEIDGTRIAGAIRDTVLVPPGSTVTIAFDADNPGLWAFHCHHLYHMATGMMATLAYEGIG